MQSEHFLKKIIIGYQFEQGTDNMWYYAIYFLNLRLLLYTPLIGQSLTSMLLDITH